MNTKSSSRFGLTLGTTSETRRRHGRFRNRHFTQAEFKLEPRSRRRLRIGSVLPVHSVASWVEVPVPKLLGTSPRTECHWVYQTVQATCALRRCADWATRHPTDGNAPTREAAKAAFQASWRQWLPWAKLGEGRGKHRFADPGSRANIRPRMSQHRIGARHDPAPLRELVGRLEPRHRQGQRDAAVRPQ